jgi:simple sugar transport system ATP-binding protein
MSEHHPGTEDKARSDAGIAVVEAQGVSKRFGATHALDRASLAIHEGEAHALVGRNGAGKSTLVSVLTGLERPDEGEVCFAGQPAPKAGDRDGWRRRVACVYQKSTLLPDLTVAENLFMNAHPRGRLGLISWRTLRARAEQALAEWDIDVDPGVQAWRLRVEERQQVEIARALASGSRFLILDEPTARLEGPAIRRLFEHVEGLRDAGVSILYISHHLEEIYEICNTVTVLRDGRVVHAGAVDELPKRALVAAMVGHDGDADAASAEERSHRRANGNGKLDGQEALRVEGLSVDGWCADVSFAVRPGELVGLAGLAGSGKAQVAEAIAGLRTPSAGNVIVAGKPVPAGNVRTAIEHGIGYVPQDRHAEGLAPNLSIEENVTLSLLHRLARFGFVPARARRQLAERVMGSLEVVASGPAQQVSELSGGNQQKVVVGRALLTEPRVLVVVSPTAGVDVASKEALFRTLTSAPELGLLVVSDELDELSHCDRVLVMFDGRVTEEFRTWHERELVAAIEGVEER